MENDFIVFIKTLKEKIGINISIFDEKGVFISGDSVEKKLIKWDFNGIVLDKDNKCTLFKIKYKNKDYIAKIDGADIEQKNYAYLISEIVANSINKEAYSSKDEFFKALICGDVSFSQIERYKKKFSLTQKNYSVMHVNFPHEQGEEVLNVITNYAESDDSVFCLDDSSCVVIRGINSEKEGCSLNEYAEIFVQSVYEETGANIQVGIGGMADCIEKLSEAYLQALSAQKLAKIFSTKGQVHLYKDFVLTKILQDIPKKKLQGYLDLMVNNGFEEIFNDTEMVGTAEAFLENSLNISETSRLLYLHRNTLAYRLDKIEKVTGLDIRKFSDALNFRLALIIYSVLKEI